MKYALTTWEKEIVDETAHAETQRWYANREIYCGDTAGKQRKRKKYTYNKKHPAPKFDGLKMVQKTYAVVECTAGNFDSTHVKNQLALAIATNQSKVLLRSKRGTYTEKQYRVLERAQ